MLYRSYMGLSVYMYMCVCVLKTTQKFVGMERTTSFFFLLTVVLFVYVLKKVFKAKVNM